MATLQERLAETYDVTEQLEAVARDEEVTDRFVVDNEDKANWAMRKLAQIQKKQATNSELADVERERIRAWEEEENGILESHAAFFEALLIDFHKREVAKEEETGVEWKKNTRKTIKLPTGTLSARARQLHVEVDDGFLEWATVARPDLVRTKVEVDKKAVNEAAVKDGEVLPHVTVEDLGPSFSVAPHKS